MLISDFSYVQAIAATPWLVFAATSHGLLIYDRATRRFRPPVTAIDGYPSGRVRRAAADPSGTAVLLDLGTESDYVRFDIEGRAWTTVPLGSVRVDRGLTVEAALAALPLADAMRAAILTDARLRTHQFTSAAATPDRPEVFFGTNGLGLVRVDKQTGEWEVLSYGLVSPAVGAVVPAPRGGGIWAAGSVRGGRDRRGLTWVAEDLSATRASEGAGAALGFTFLHSRRLLNSGDQLWLASEQGVWRIDPMTFRSRQFDLPDATCLAAAPDGVWVGTTRGLSIITADERVTPIGPSGLPIVSLLAVGETLWVGTTSGLGVLIPGAPQIVSAPELADRPSLRTTIHALGRVRDTIVMATAQELHWRDGATRAWSSLPLPAALGTPTALTPRANGGLWVGGLQGLAYVDIARPSIQLHPVPIELPAGVRDLATSGDYLWVATDSGLVRIR